MPRSLPILTLFVLLAGASVSPGQVLRELDPVELEYRVLVDGEKVGSVEASFVVADTPRGRRLRVENSMSYRVGTDNPVEYDETATLLCDAEGVEKFETSRTFGEHEEKYVGIRIDIDYHITATVNGETGGTSDGSAATMAR